MKVSQPRYLSLYESGELQRRVEALEARLEKCDICPRQCGVDRRHGEIGFCRSGYRPIVAASLAHHGEEPALSGSRGSGTIFFGNCNLRCVYCQNYQISQRPAANLKNEISIEELVRTMLFLQDQLQCHNINLVTPSHFVPQIVRAVYEAIPQGLHLPLVYNTSSYDSLPTLQKLDGIVDIYLADLRYASDQMAVKYSRADLYVKISRRAIKEMYRQVGELELDDQEIAVRGLIVRHLILPGDIAGSRDCLTWLASELSPKVTVSIMSQYYPAHRACRYPELARQIRPEEYEGVVAFLDELGLENGWIQEMTSAKEYRPDFSAPEPFPRHDTQRSG